MNNLLLLGLIVLDILLFGYVYFSNRNRNIGGRLLDEMKEERKMTMELRESLKDQIKIAEEKLLSQQDKLVALASESELEHASVKKILEEHVDVLVSEIEGKIHEPIEKVNERCDRAHRFLDRINKERENLLSALKKAETLARFFNKELPYSDLLEEIEDKKYLDARHMLSKGVSVEEVSGELNMPLAEVKLLLSLV